MDQVSPMPIPSYDHLAESTVITLVDWYPFPSLISILLWGDITSHCY